MKLANSVLENHRLALADVGDESVLVLHVIMSLSPRQLFDNSQPGQPNSNSPSRTSLRITPLRVRKSFAIGIATTFCAKNTTDRKKLPRNYFLIADTEFRIFRIN